MKTKGMQILFFFLIFFEVFCSAAAVTYDFSGGRFGDNLVTYLHAKWLAYENQIPLLYRPFPYSSELLIEEKEIHYDSFASHYQGSITLSPNNPIPIASSPYIFFSRYFPEVAWDLTLPNDCFLYEVNWKDKEFRKIVWEIIQPKKKLQLVYPPENVISIAIHVREGGGCDSDDLYLGHPLKAPPLSYYIECLHKVFELFKEKQFYCHIFTDAKQPQELVEKIQQACPCEIHIIFGYRKENNFHNANVLEDFFSLFNFDILIRPESHYSIVPSLIHDYAIVYSPSTYIIHEKTVVNVR